MTLSKLPPDYTLRSEHPIELVVCHTDKGVVYQINRENSRMTDAKIMLHLAEIGRMCQARIAELMAEGVTE